MRVLVASRGPSLATVLESAGHDVIDARPGDAHAWGIDDIAPTCEAALIDLSDAALARQALSHLAEAQPTARLIVIRGSDASWASFTNPHDALVVTPPFTREALIAAIEHIGRTPPVDQTPAPEPDAPKADVASASNDAPTLGSTPARSASRGLSAPPPNERPLAECVRRLVTSADTLLDLREVGDAVAALVAERVGAEGVALALPDGPVWRVTGGFGLRAVEGRMIITQKHWLTTDLVTAQRGVVIEHTDITRAQLRQAPLAAMDYLIIATDRTSRSILMAGRDSAPFTRDDLATLQRTLREALAAIRDGLDLRALARKLERFSDPA